MSQVSITIVLNMTFVMRIYFINGYMIPSRGANGNKV